MKTHAKQLMEFIDNSPSVYHAVNNLEGILKENGFIGLDPSQAFKLEPHGRYYLTNNGSAIIAWQNGSSVKEGFRMIGTHADSPTFKLKTNPEIISSNSYVTLNTQVYGGAILSTWFDRPLSLAGRAIIKSKDLLKPEVKLINFENPLLVIPNLAIHMNRTVNDGYTFNSQKDTLPLLTILEKINKELENTFKNNNLIYDLVAKKLNIEKQEILDLDLYLYACQKGEFVGLNGEFMSVGKLDNLGMAFASVQSIIKAKKAPFTQLISVFDNEEIGSGTAQGAGSPFFSDTLKRIAFAEDSQNGYELFQNAMAKSFLISADQAHGIHPNYAEKNDPTNMPMLNGGPVVKYSAAMNYTTDGVSAGIFRDLCEKAGVPCQSFYNRSDMRGGSTIGPITMNQLNVKSVDIGNAIFSMHSVRELGGALDQEYIIKVFDQFFQE